MSNNNKNQIFPMLYIVNNNTFYVFEVINININKQLTRKFRKKKIFFTSLRIVFNTRFFFSFPKDTGNEESNVGKPKATLNSNNV